MNLLKTTTVALALVGLAFVAMVDVSIAQDKKKLVAFYPGSTDTYVGAVIKALKAEAATAGYDIEVIENGYFNQTNQDQQVQQYLALGEKPDLFMWWPSETEGGIGSLRALAKTGTPVLLINAQPTASVLPYIIGQEGPDDLFRADNAGKMIVELRDKMKAAGIELHGTGGNAVALTYPGSYPPTAPSLAAFSKAIEGSGISLLGSSDEGFGAANGEAGMSKLLALYREQGIDLVYAMDDQILQGAVKALKDAGMEVGVGKQVGIVGTVCHGDRRLLDEGVEYATSLQSPVLDAQLSIKVVDEYLKNGKLAKAINLFPNPPVRWNEWKTMTLVDYHGKTRTMDELCPWS